MAKPDEVAGHPDLVEVRVAFAQHVKICTEANARNEKDHLQMKVGLAGLYAILLGGGGTLLYLMIEYLLNNMPLVQALSTSGG